MPNHVVIDVPHLAYPSATNRTSPGLPVSDRPSRAGPSGHTTPSRQRRSVSRRAVTDLPHQPVSDRPSRTVSDKPHQSVRDEPSRAIPSATCRAYPDRQDIPDRTAPSPTDLPAPSATFHAGPARTVRQRQTSPLHAYPSVTNPAAPVRLDKPSRPASVRHDSPDRAV